ncbi:MAG: hypothetical protein ACLQE9_07985 [Roseiarcus sp.]
MLSGKLAGAKAAIAGALAMIMAATAAGAAVLPAPVVDASISGVQLAAGNVCGPGAQQGANGVCHPDSWFVRRRICPFGMHLGPMGHRCLPN